MMRKWVLFIANSLDSAYRFQQVLREFDVEITAVSMTQAPLFLTTETSPDLVIFEAQTTTWSHLEEIESLVEGCGCPLLIIVDGENVRQLQLPVRIPCDFVTQDAGHAECSVRIGRLLGAASAGEHGDSIQVGSMVLNLATYQVTVAGDPIDLTYLEYALLAFLVQHPGRTFTRDALLQSVWGFDYYGGSRTVDVHVRRIRAKLGPELARHLETVRGVGYLWSSQ